jgi:hypothetical protein
MGREERIFLGGELGHRSPETPKLPRARQVGQPDVEPDAPVDRPELPDGEVFVFRQDRFRRPQQAPQVGRRR